MCLLSLNQVEREMILRALDEKPVAAMPRDLGQAVAAQPHYRRARRQSLEIDLSPGVIQHRLHQESRLSIQALQLLPRQMGAQLDIAMRRHEGPTAFIAHDGQPEVGTPELCQTERFDQQQSALGLE